MARRLVIALGVVCSIGGASTAANATTISAPSVVVDVGDTFTIPFSIAGAVDLTSWQFDLTFNPVIVRVDSVAEGPFLSSFGGTLFIPPLIVDNTLGLISGMADFYVDVPPNPAGGGTLANIGFTALAPGISPLKFSGVFLNLFDSGFDIANGQITVRDAQPPAPSPSVPEPATLTLVAGGGVLLVRRLRSRRAALMTLAASAALFGCALDADAQPSSNFFYPTPSWNQTLAANVRFVYVLQERICAGAICVNGPPEGILDRETGLVWELTPTNGLVFWPAAVSACLQLTKGGRKGWRLPTIHELDSLIDPTVPPGQLALPAGNPFYDVRSGDSGGYWSTTATPFGANVFGRFFTISNELQLPTETGRAHVWCVRGGQGFAVR